MTMWFFLSFLFHLNIFNYQRNFKRLVFYSTVQYNAKTFLYSTIFQLNLNNWSQHPMGENDLILLICSTGHTWYKQLFNVPPPQSDIDLLLFNIRTFHCTDLQQELVALPQDSHSSWLPWPPFQSTVKIKSEFQYSSSS